MSSLDGDLVLMRAFGKPWPSEATETLWELESRVGGGESEGKGGTVVEEEFGRVPETTYIKRTKIAMFIIQPWSIPSLYLVK